MKNALIKKLAILMCAAMLITCMPVGVYAGTIERTEIATETVAETVAETAPETVNEPESTDTTPSEAPYIILETVADDGVSVVLTAEKDAFGISEGLELVAETVSGEEAEEAGKEIDKETETDNVAKRVTYDIRVEKDGEEVQPLEGKQVKVAFHLPEIPSGADEVTIYHHDDTDGLEVIASEALSGDAQTVASDAAGINTGDDESDEEYIEDAEIINDLSLEGNTDSFSLYTVDFTYGDKTVSIQGDTDRNPLAEILEEAGITDGIDDVEVYSDSIFDNRCEDRSVRDGDRILFRIYCDNGIWYADAVNAFSEEYGIIVKTAEGDYRVKVTDYQPSGRYLTFTAAQDGSSVRFQYYSGSDVEYIVETSGVWGEWQTYPGPQTAGLTVTLPKAGDKVVFRGSNVTTDGSYHFSMSGKINASGDITSLINKVGGDVPMITRACFYMFSQCYALLTAPDLPSGNLADGCYYNMFRQCTGLTEVPELKATVVPKQAYCYMFYGCTSLKKAASLPALTIGESAYQSMFEQCTNIEEFPEMKAVNFTGGQCCYAMFNNCRRLRKIPKVLPATTMTKACYQDMFRGCSSLETPPRLPATELAEVCYGRMFYDCTSLKNVMELPATQLKKESYWQMFINCDALTSITDLSHVTGMDSRCCYQMYHMGTVKISTGQDDTYIYEWIAPSGTGSGALTGMFASNGSPVTSPIAGGIYYCTVPLYVAPEEPDEPVITSSDHKDEEWTAIPTIIGSIDRAVSTGIWRMREGKWQYLMDSSPLVNTIASISYNAGDGKNHIGWFYLGKYGCMMVGWQQFDNKWYYFNEIPGSEYGMMLKDTVTPDGYKVGPDGAWVR